MRRGVRQMLRVVGIALAMAPAAQAQTPSGKPPIPPGAPTQGFAVALLSDGIDYTRADITGKLARDGEGVIVGWDAIDGDQRPYLANGAATHLIELAPFLIAPFRLKLNEPASWQRTMDVLKRTPARIAVVAAAPSEIGAADTWTTAMAGLADVLFVLPAEDNGPVNRAGNILLVAALTPAGVATRSADLALAPAAAAREMPTTAAPGGRLPATNLEAALLLPSLFACLDLRAATSPADVKRRLIAKAQKGTAGTPPLLGLCR